MSAFQTVEEYNGTRCRRLLESSMFDKTLQFSFSNPMRAWLKTEVVELGRNIQLWRVRSTGHEISLQEPGKFTYLLPLRGRLDTTVGDGEHKAEADSALLLSPNERRTRVSPAPRSIYEALVLMFPQGSIRNSASGHRLTQGDLAMSLPAGCECGDSLRAYTSFLGTELSRRASPVARPNSLAHAGALLEEMFIGALDEDELRASRRTSAGIKYVERAEELMRSRYDEALTMAEIADALNITPRSLQLAYREHLGVTPRARLTQIRLEAARALLRGADPDQNVGSIAFDCGFTHLGRFAIAYRKAFGELPSETLR